MIGWLLGTRLGRALSAAAAAVAALLTLRAVWRRDGAQEARRRAQEDDYENADAIRDRVDRDLDERVRELDGRGWRD